MLGIDPGAEDPAVDMPLSLFTEISHFRFGYEHTLTGLESPLMEALTSVHVFARLPSETKSSHLLIYQTSLHVRQVISFPFLLF